jgi:hypothetical protein
VGYVLNCGRGRRWSSFDHISCLINFGRLYLNISQP